MIATWLTACHLLMQLGHGMTRPCLRQRAWLHGPIAGLRLLRPSGLDALCDRIAVSFMDWRELSTVLAALTRPSWVSSAVSDTASGAVVKSPSVLFVFDIVTYSRQQRVQRRTAARHGALLYSWKRAISQRRRPAADTQLHPYGSILQFIRTCYQ